MPILYEVILFRERHKIDTLPVKRKYGFLYNGYSKKAYYWEIVISGRKIIIAFASIFLSVKGTMLQSLALLFILAFSIFVTLKVNPYVDFRMNRLEIISLLSLSLTAYCGVFFLSDRDPKAMDFVQGKDCKVELKISGLESLVKVVSLSSNSHFKWLLPFTLAFLSSDALQTNVHFEDELLLPLLLSVWESEEADGCDPTK